MFKKLLLQVKFACTSARSRDRCCAPKNFLSGEVIFLFKRKKVTVKVTVNQQKILNLIKENLFITQEELFKIIGITRKSVISNMKKLQDVGLIKRIGADKNGYWQLEE